MATAPSIQISIESRQLGNDQIDSVDARELHSVLGVGRDFSNWIKNRIKQYSFEEGVDYTALIRSPKRASGDFDSPERANQKRGGDRRSVDYFVTLDMAKELAMVERNEKGREARRYFIECEKRLKQQRRTDPPALPAAEADRVRRMAQGQPLLNDAVRAEIDRQAQLLSSRTAPHYRNRLLTEALKTFPDSPELIPTLAETIWANEQRRDEIDGVPVAWMREGYELCVSWLTYSKSSALPTWLKASKLECWEGDMERFGKHFECDWP